MAHTALPLCSFKYGTTLNFYSNAFSKVCVKKRSLFVDQQERFYFRLWVLEVQKRTLVCSSIPQNFCPYRAYTTNVYYHVHWFACLIAQQYFQAWFWPGFFFLNFRNRECVPYWNFPKLWHDYIALPSRYLLCNVIHRVIVEKKMAQNSRLLIMISAW